MSSYCESALLIVGDELLSGRTRDVNLFRFSGILSDMGLPVVTARVVRDVPSEIEDAVRALMSSGRILIVTGGMGPTDDDVTVAAVSRATSRPLQRSLPAAEMVKSRQLHYGLGLPESAFKQADIPLGASPVMNPAGIAPGIVIREEDSALICIPGVPSESTALLPACLKEAGVQSRSAKPVYFMRTWGLKENALYDQLKEIAQACGVVPAYLPSPGRVDIKVTGGNSSEFIEQVNKLLGSRIYSHLRDESIEEVLGRKLLEMGFNLATAESCTGGGIGRGITSVPGSSGWYTGGVICYSNQLKRDILGIDSEILDTHGAVSRETAILMARGVRELTGADCGLSVTGIAGPSGGSLEKPVGTVWTAAVSPSDERVDQWRLGGNRESVRNGAISRALGSMLELL